MLKLAEFLPATPGLLWQWARQIGIRHAICKCAPELTGLNAPADIDSLRTIQRRFADAGFVLYGLEGDEFDMSRIKLGLPGWEEDIARYQRMLRNMGALGIPLLCYNFMAGTGWHRSTKDAPGRGGALVTRFRLGEMPAHTGERVSSERIWENYTRSAPRHQQFDDAQKAADRACTLQPEGKLNALGRMFSGDIAFTRGLPPHFAASLPQRSWASMLLKTG